MRRSLACVECDTRDWRVGRAELLERFPIEMSEALVHEVDGSGVFDRSCGSGGDGRETEPILTAFEMAYAERDLVTLYTRLSVAKDCENLYGQERTWTGYDG